MTELTSAGIKSRRRDVQTRPMKLLDCAMRTASLRELEVRPQLVTMERAVLGSCEVVGEAGATPSSLQRRIGSERGSQ